MRILGQQENGKLSESAASSNAADFYNRQARPLASFEDEGLYDIGRYSHN